MFASSVLIACLRVQSCRHSEWESNPQVRIVCTDRPWPDVVN